MTYPRIRTVWRNTGCPGVTIQYAEHGEVYTCCGHTWCVGCILPAATVASLRVYSSMVACGKVVQPFRTSWNGSTHVVPQEFAAELRKRYWL